MLSTLVPCSASPVRTSGRPELLTREAAWKPSAGTTWNYQLTGTINLASTNVDVWDIDLFDAESSTIDSIHAQDKHVICYFSAESFEEWRPDAFRFQSSDIGNAMEGWYGENWLQVKSNNVRNIMLARLDLAMQKKCDGVEPDNVDGYDNENGLQLTEDDAIDYITFLANASHSRGMAVGLKNSASVVGRLVSKVEYSVQEECVQYRDCDEFRPFVEQNKPVFHVEYSGGGLMKRTFWKDGLGVEDAGGDYSMTSDANEGTLTQDDTNGAALAGYTTAPTVNSTSDSTGNAAYPVDSVQQTPSVTIVSPTSTNTGNVNRGTSAENDIIDDGSIALVISSSNTNLAATLSSACGASVAGFSTIVKELELGPWIQVCY